MLLNLFYKYYEKNSQKTLTKLMVKFFTRGGYRKHKWLKLCGTKIGEGTKITCSLDAFPEPYMVELGNKVYVSDGVSFMTHDGALSWMSRAMGYTDKRTDKIGKIVVKDNCFIGAKAVIMQNVTIGNNCIVGMGAIVTKDVPDNSVVAGVPAKVVCSIEDFLDKHKDCKDYTCGWSYGKKRNYYENKF